ncbi:MAG: PilZ domain-containing protein [Spongiibacteraceae bacterium]|jgi:hypothetical protein|nr:PilZ domain-containing protein [Spongiibacteraceae bacterium]
MNYVEQRRHPRTPTTALVELSHPGIGQLEMAARDLSEGGIYVVTGGRFKPPVGTVLQVRIKRHTGVLNEEPVPMRVVHHQSDGMGLAFV